MISFKRTENYTDLIDDGMGMTKEQLINMWDMLFVRIILLKNLVVYRV